MNGTSSVVVCLAAVAVITSERRKIQNKEGCRIINPFYAAGDSIAHYYGIESLHIIARSTSGYSGKSEARELHFQRWPPKFQLGPQP